MTEPTDDELAKLFAEETGFDVDDFPAAILDFARAARARWGQPSGAGEVVAWRYRMKGDLQWQYTERPEQFTHADEVQELTTPQPTQAVPPAGREPLTEVQIEAINTRTLGHQHFARAIEAEVRRNEALRAKRLSQSFAQLYPPNPDAACKCEHWQYCAECHPTAPQQEAQEGGIKGGQHGTE